MLIFQKPGRPDLLDAINNAAQNAESGGGAFAFASKGGIAVLLSASHVKNMLKNGRPIHLIVGVDSITNAEALLYLADQVKKYNVLHAEVFMHDHPYSTFHPKFSWFASADRLTLLTGSGNLTVRGLGQYSTANPPHGNWEAFSVQTFDGPQSKQINNQILGWIDEQRKLGVLRDIDDQDVWKRAVENSRVWIIRRPPPLATHEQKPAQTSTIFLDNEEEIITKQAVLVREIPRNRHGQADIGKSALTNFFGYNGEPINIFLQNVSLNDEIGEIEQKRLFVNKSRNYRVELQAIASLKYEVTSHDERMILVATKFDNCSFRYTIVPVTSKEYPKVSAMLGKIPPARGNSRPMRERIMPIEDLNEEWPGAPRNLLPIQAISSED